MGHDSAPPAWSEQFCSETQGAGRRCTGACTAHVRSGRLLALASMLSASAVAEASPHDPPSASSFAYTISHAVTPLPNAVIERTIDADGMPFEYGEDGDNFEHPPDKPADPRLGPPRALSRATVCATIVSVARTYQLPVPFFANLIWQESNFNPRDVSRAGAQGIAQFMPKTAVIYDLINPFESLHALNVAARFLRELHGRFGNLGLAAAAYNGGPTRVANWLAGRGALPAETRNYVVRITGRPAADWTAPDVASKPDMTLMPAKAPCARGQGSGGAAGQDRARHQVDDGAGRGHRAATAARAGGCRKAGCRYEGRRRQRSKAEGRPAPGRGSPKGHRQGASQSLPTKGPSRPTRQVSGKQAAARRWSASRMPTRSPTSRATRRIAERGRQVEGDREGHDAKELTPRRASLRPRASATASTPGSPSARAVASTASRAGCRLCC